MEAVVDAYGPEEQAMGWFYHLEGRLSFPFTASCDRKRSISPLKPSKSPEDECAREMFVNVEFGEDNDEMAVPLMQLMIPQPKSVDDEDEDEFCEQSWEAIEDWRYWVDRGYEFG